MPDDYRSVLDAGLAALAIGLDEDARRAIDDHTRLLLAWTTAINLTSIREPAEIARLHVVDSLTALPILRDRGADSFVDLGSGGGYPGLPLAAALPTGRALLVESVGKKAAFLAAVVQATGLAGRVDVAAERAEAVARDRRHRERWAAVTARAVASLGELVELAFPLLATGGILIAWKRGRIDDELAAGRRAAAALGGGRLALVDPHADAPGLADHRLVVATKTGHVATAWPRDPAVRRREPW